MRRHVEFLLCTLYVYIKALIITVVELSAKSTIKLSGEVVKNRPIDSLYHDWDHDWEMIM